jgi:hypothetical protein
MSFHLGCTGWGWPLASISLAFLQINPTPAAEVELHCSPPCPVPLRTDLWCLLVARSTWDWEQPSPGIFIPTVVLGVAFLALNSLQKIKLYIMSQSARTQPQHLASSWRPHRTAVDS